MFALLARNVRKYASYESAHETCAHKRYTPRLLGNQSDDTTTSRHGNSFKTAYRLRDGALTNLSTRGNGCSYSGTQEPTNP